MCVISSVNQLVSQLIVLNNFSVDKWVLPPYPYPLPSVCPFVSQPVCSIDDSVYQLCCQQMSECCHPTFGPTLCFLLSVNQSVSQFIVLTNFSVSKWVSAAALPLPFTQCVSFFQSTSLAHVLIYKNILTWLWCFKKKIANFSPLQSCLTIPRRDLRTKKKLNQLYKNDQKASESSWNFNMLNVGYW